MAYDETTLVAIGVVLPLLGFITIGLRLYVRLKVHPLPLGWDDWLILVAGILMIAMQVWHFTGIYIGLNGHDYEGADASPTHSARGKMNTMLTYIVVVIEKPLYGAIKLSVLFFYRRIFSTHRFRIATNILIVLMAAWTLVYLFIEIFQCGTHVTTQWTQPTLCVSRYGLRDHPSVLLSFGITDIIGDVAILILPYPQIRKLHMPLRERWTVAGIFMLGWLSTAAGVARFYFVVHATKIDQEAIKAGNVVPVYTPPSTWTFTEICVGIIAANLPPLGPLLRKAPSPAELVSATKAKLWKTWSGASSTTIHPIIDEETPPQIDQQIDRMSSLGIPEPLLLKESKMPELQRH